ncbi:MAG: sigma-70 family RNA polymerase sigma factor [Chitinophagales bacterium]|nr:sigma-70 family RNA polymerase sigma factor [Chitinophagaceae bacterium]MCB9065791.1 sigma-70 family RNA polymerase sigma factor [Chitinophagales bacterium]
MALSKNNSAPPSHVGGGVSVWDNTTILIQECIARNREAQKALYDKYAPTAYSLIKRYTRHDELAAEMLNDAFYKVLTKLEQYSHEGSFEGWIRRIVVNTVTDHLRKHIRKREHEVLTDVPENVSFDNDIVGGMSYKELLVLVHELPDMQRAVFNMYVFEDYKHKEIAEVLDTTEGNSRWYLNDARKRLKEKIYSVMKR